MINPIGVELGAKYCVKFFEIDWKKDGRPSFAKATVGRQEKARKIIEERGIYRQNYCGCVYSKAYDADKARKASQAL